jgi:hypothetical protein
MNLDVEIYMNNVIKFFRENPNDLLNLSIQRQGGIFLYQNQRSCD